MFIESCKSIYEHIKEKSSNFLELVKALLISLILQEYKLMNEKKMFFQKNSIEFSKQPYYSYIAKAFFSEIYSNVTYDKKYEFIANNIRFDSDKNVHNFFFYQETKEYLIFLIRYIKNSIEESNKENFKVLFSCLNNYMWEIACTYEKDFEKKNNSKKELENPIFCIFFHLFSSSEICTEFYSIYFKYFDFSEIKLYIEEFIQRLIKFHPNSFLFALLIRLTELKYNNEFYFILDIIVKFLNKNFEKNFLSITNNSSEILGNVINTLKMFYYLIIKELVSWKDLKERVISFIALFFIKNEMIYLENYFSSKTVYEMILKIFLKTEGIDLFKRYLTIRNEDFSFMACKIDFAKSKNISITPLSKRFQQIQEYFNKKRFLVSTQSMIVLTVQEIIKLEELPKDIIKSIIEEGHCFLSNVQQRKFSFDNEESISFKVKVLNELQAMEEKIQTKEKKKPQKNEDKNFEEDLANFWENEKDCLLKKNCFLLCSNSNKLNEKKSEIKKQIIPKQNKECKTFFNINKPEIVLCLKRDLLLKKLSIYFKDIYFEDKNFLKLKKLYKFKILNNYKSNPENKVTIYDEEKEELSLNYPSILRNYSCYKAFYPKIFLKQNLKFYSHCYFKVSHPYFYRNNDEKPKIIEKPIFSHIIKINPQTFNLFYEEEEENKLKDEEYKIFDCEYINTTGNYLGKLKVTKNYIIFISAKNPHQYLNKLDFIFCSDEICMKDVNKEIIIQMFNLKEVIQRRFLYMEQAIEFYLLNGKSYFFNLFSVENNKIFFEFLKFLELKDTVLISSPKEFFHNENFTEKWREKIIDNFQYILYINKFAYRSYNDLNQYVIVPWIFLTFQDKNKKDSEEIKVRDFKYPISAQTEDGKKRARDSYQNSFEDTKFPCHFRLHYSTSAFIVLYLGRISPFTENQIKLQNEKFDSPNRQFFSFGELIKILQSNNDNRELIPEIFLTFEYFYNLNQNFFGQRVDKLLVNNVVVPEHYKSPCGFVYSQRMKFNSENVKSNIIYWIDNIFGCNQNNFRKEKLNTFSKSSYGNKVNLMKKVEKYKEKGLTEEEVIEKIKCKRISILSFGQAPYQLFSKKHCEWEKKERAEEKITDQYDLTRSFVNELIEFKTKEIKEEAILINFTTNKDKLYLLTKRKQNKNLTIQIFNVNEIKNERTVEIEKIKLFRATFFKEVSSSKNNSFSLNPKYCLFDFDNGNFFFVGRNCDNCIKIYKLNENKYVSIKTESFVSCLVKFNNSSSTKMSFFSGHKNGKLIEWEIKTEISKKKIIEKIQIIPKRDIVSHEKMITAIAYVDMQDLILTCGREGCLHIRKYSDFELMQVIGSGDNSQFFTDCFYSSYDLIYTQSLQKDKFYLKGYSVNGLRFSKSKQNSFRRIFINRKGKLIALAANDLYVFNGNDLEKEKEMNIEEMMSEKINKRENKKNIELEIKNIVDFTYSEENNTFYFVYSSSESYVIKRIINTDKKKKIILLSNPCDKI